MSADPTILERCGTVTAGVSESVGAICQSFGMAKLSYLAITSLDGYVADRDGSFEWSTPDAEVHAFVNELASSAGTYLYGRRMYELMSVWDQPERLPDPSPEIRQFAAIWQAAEKVVYSRTLADVSTTRTRLERSFDPTAVAEMKRQRTADILIGGAELAGQAFRAGLVDELHLFPNPILVGGGKPALPTDVWLELELVDLRRFTNGVGYLYYRRRSEPPQGW